MRTYLLAASRSSLSLCSLRLLRTPCTAIQAHRTFSSEPAPKSSTEFMQMERHYCAQTYHPLPVVFAKASGVDVWDPEGKHYYDFLSAYSAVNQGHCHPRLLAALSEQAQKLTLSSRAFYSDTFPRFAKFATDYFGFEAILPMNSGAEAVETALKLAKKWGYKKKKIPEGKAVVVNFSGCFHGRTMAVISMSDDPSAFTDYGPYLTGFERVPFNDTEALEAVLKKHGENICGVLMEPIQGEAGVIIPSDGYVARAAELCRQHNVLFIADEIQTGIGRTGKLLAVDYDGVKPDILILGKAISGGILPLSAILAPKEIMDCFRPGEHGSTFGGNPLASAVGMAALSVIKEEKLVENAYRQGEKLRTALREMKLDYLLDVRGRGLLSAIELDPKSKYSAWQLCLLLAQHGILCKPTHENIIRLAPPLVINDKQMQECLDIFSDVLTKFPRLTPEQLAEQSLADD